jgi:hypothetical protein
VSVKAYFRGAEIAGKPPEDGDKGVLYIDNSSIFRWQQAFGKMELLATGLTIGLAIATGLSTYWVNNLTFGSASDYLSLLLWGAGADQAKNFVQLLGGSTGAGGGQP